MMAPKDNLGAIMVYTFTVDSTDTATGHRLHGVLTVEEPAPPPPPPHVVRLGADFPPAEDAEHRGLFPNLRYRALFGDTWAECDSLLAAEPAEVLAHISAKVHSTAALNALMDKLDRDIWLTYYHEPMGDVTPASYRATAHNVAADIAAHPNGHRVVLNGPCLTRYWIDPAQGAGNPEDWWYDGANAFFNDCYTGGGQYRSPQNMFDATIAYAATKGVPWAVRELGGSRIGSDTTGSVRAQWLRDLVDYAEKNDCLAMAWFCKGSTGHLENYPAELAAWQELMAARA